jgi:hypothetical protein
VPVGPLKTKRGLQPTWKWSAEEMAVAERRAANKLGNGGLSGFVTCGGRIESLSSHTFLSLGNRSFTSKA